MTKINLPSKQAISNFNAFVSQNDALFAANIAAYKNKQPQEGLTPIQGKILATSRFIPANGARWVAGRDSNTPAYVVLARASNETGSIDSASVISGINKVVNLIQGKDTSLLTPHLFISYTGDIIQFVDFDDTALYLDNSFMPQSPIPQANLLDRAIYETMAFTVANEAGLNIFEAFDGNDLGFGVSIGFVQFNQDKGPLFTLMNNMWKRDSTLYQQIFGDTLTAKMPLASPDQLTADNCIHSSKLALSGFRDAFIKAGQQPKFQEEQIKLAKKIYWDSIDQLAQQYQLASQRSYAVLFDAAIQFGTPRVAEYLAKAEVRKMSTEKDKIREFALLIDSRPHSGNRRTNMYNNPDVSDLPLLYIDTESAVAAGQIEDKTSITVVLEGRSSDPITLNQLGSLVQALRIVCDEYTIPVSTSRIIGLDRLTDTFGINPGELFDYGDLITRLSATPHTDSASRFIPEVNTLSLIATKAATDIITSLSNATNHLDKLISLQAYATVAAADRAGYASLFSRSSHMQAASEELQTKRLIRAQFGAALDSAQASLVFPGTPSDSVLTGFIFNFDIGLWSDGKAGGPVS